MLEDEDSSTIPTTLIIISILRIAFFLLQSLRKGEDFTRTKHTLVGTFYPASGVCFGLSVSVRVGIS